MASLMENLITVLEKENIEYLQLVKMSITKTGVIVSGDIDKLNKITDEEQNVVSKINILEKQREEAIQDIANVLNKDVTTLKLIDIIQMLEKRPEEQQKLALIHGKLQETLANMVKINEQNKLLIGNALDLVEFDLNLVQAASRAPETANYNKGANSAGSTMGRVVGSFDAKQ